jgi:hypothetical protein
MGKQVQCLIGVTGLVAAMGLAFLPHATAQAIAQANFQGRGVTQGSTFTRGRNANASLNIDGNNFGLEFAEPSRTGASVQYRGSIIRQTNGSTNSGSFILDGRVRSFNASANPQATNNTSGSCRIEVFDSRVVSSSCNTSVSNSSTRFLGLEQF